MKVFQWVEERMSALGERIGSPFEALELWLDSRFQSKITGAVEDFMEDFEQELLPNVKPIIEKILDNPNIPDDIRKQLKDLKEPDAFAFAPILLGVLALNLIPVLSASSSGGIEQVRQGSMMAFKPSLLGVDEALSALWRGKWDPDTFKHELNQHGFNSERQEIIKEVRRYVPNANDLIRFTVRDVFREDIVEKYGYDTDFDKISDDLQPWLDKIGMDKDVMRNYWRAHWALPSIGQGFDMLHRGQIEIEDIRTLLKISDVAPAWVEPIIKVAYSPYTRVDVRRMYASGIIDKDAVMRAYLDLGYDDEHADNLTSWTIAESMSTEKDLSKTEILTGYNQGSIPPDTAKSALSDMGYDSSEVELILAIQDYKIESKILDREKKILINHFTRGEIDIIELNKGLGALGLNEKEINITCEEARSKVREKTACPTKADLKKWLEAKVISDEQYMFEMRLKGYSQAHIENYLATGG